jgi:hypothetical protein
VPLHGGAGRIWHTNFFHFVSVVCFCSKYGLISEHRQTIPVSLPRFLRVLGALLFKSAVEFIGAPVTSAQFHESAQFIVPFSSDEAG